MAELPQRPLDRCHVPRACERSRARRRAESSRARGGDGRTRRDEVAGEPRPHARVCRANRSPVRPGLEPRTLAGGREGFCVCVGVVSAASAWQACHTTILPDAGTAPTLNANTQHSTPHTCRTPHTRDIPSCHWRGGGPGGRLRLPPDCERLVVPGQAQVHEPFDGVQLSDGTEPLVQLLPEVLGRVDQFRVIAPADVCLVLDVRQHGQNAPRRRAVDGDDPPGPAVGSTERRATQVAGA